MITPYNPKDVVPYYPTCIDIETSPDGDVLDIGMVYTDEQNRQCYETFADWQQFTTRIIRLLRDYKNNHTMRDRFRRIYAHNGVGFDWLSYLSFLIDHSGIRDCNVLMSEQMVIGITVTFHTGDHLALCDSIRLLPYGLKEIASKLNTDHQKLYTGDYITRMHEYKRDNPDEYYAYLKEDCYALSEAIYRFWCIIYQLEGTIGALPLTLPSLALRIFRKNLPYEISTPWNEKVRAFTRRSYTGGRVDCYAAGSYDNVSVYDVNSMYPAMMSSIAVPVSHRGYWTIEFDPSSCGFYEVTYAQPQEPYPPLLRDETSREFAYCGSGVFTTTELSELLSIGGSFHVSNGYEFCDTKILFYDFITKYYSLRMQAKIQGDEALVFICKILMNSLYGKFGQSDVLKRIELATNEKIDRYIDEGKTFRVMQDFLIVEETKRAENEFVAIASMITSSARVLLYQYIKQAGTAYVYADTDSVHISNGTLTTGDGLGEMKLEKSGPGVYIGRKLYAIGDKVTAKGIGREAIKNGTVSRDTLTTLLDRSQRLTVTVNTFPTLREVMKGLQPCKQVTRTRTIRRTS